MRAAKFVVQREGNANNEYFTSKFFFFKQSMREMLRRDRDLQTINAVRQFGERWMRE
jgi:hypothetical protein